MRLFFLIMYFCAGLTYADCEFQLVNNSSVPVKFMMGINYPQSSPAVTMLVQPARVVTKKLPSPANCTTIGLGNTGVAYVNLVGGQSNGSWHYLPDQNMIRASGGGLNGQDWVSGSAPNGKTIVLKNKFNPDSDTFVAKVEDGGGGPSRQTSSMG